MSFKEFIHIERDDFITQKIGIFFIPFDINVQLNIVTLEI
jgi:hypothetical protein